VPQASQRRWSFECDFGVLCPAQRRRAMRKGSALLMQHGRAAADANNRRIARRTVGLFAYFDGRHDDFRGDIKGDKPFLPLYVPSATSKLPGMPRNTAETPQVENAIKIDVSAEKSSHFIDRRISVAPMMDWTDAL
jgi:hypothetical protein